MPTLLPKDTAALFEANANRFDSRSLWMDRFARPDLESKERRPWFDSLLKKEAVRINRCIWYPAGQSELIYAQLQSRLMVNMAGGVMENAGLCLDRFGLPYIPGSAVKGCARRAALAALREWCECGERPNGEDNLFTPACEPFATPADMLSAIAHVFGWGDQEWTDKRKDGRFVSDFAWACSGVSDSPASTGRDKPAQGNALGSDSVNNPSPEGAAQTWTTIRDTVIRQLARELRVSIPEDEKEPWNRLPNFAGSVSFLPAHLVDIPAGTDLSGMKTPALGKLELDVVTCHHPEYYRAERKVATDDEDPNPVVFPAVAPGHVFAFALVPLRVANDKRLVEHARTWLKTGLDTFGLGAKTNAGYGWFDASNSVTSAVTILLTEKAAKERAEAEAKVKAAEKAQREAALAGLSPDQRADKEIELMTESQFANKVRAFAKEPKKGGPTDDQRKAIVRALRGPRLAYWQEFKTKANKGDLAKAATEIRLLSKQMFPGSEGKMP